MDYIHEFCDCKQCSRAHFSEITVCKYCDRSKGLYFQECEYLTLDDRRNGLVKFVQKIGDGIKVKYRKWLVGFYLKKGYVTDRVFNGIKIRKSKSVFDGPPYPMEYERKEDKCVNSKNMSETEWGVCRKRTHIRRHG